MKPTVFSETDLDQIGAYAERLADVLNQRVKQTDVDLGIQNSRYGYALFGELMDNHRRPEGGSPLLTPYSMFLPDAGEPHKQLIVASQSDWMYSIISDNPEWDHTDWLHRAYAYEGARVLGCDVHISDLCTNSDQTQMIFDRGELLGYWGMCSTCQTWLHAMAKAE